MTEAAAIVPPELGPSAMTDAPSLMSLRSAPATLTFVDAVVVTVTGWPPAVLMTRPPPFTCSSVPLASSNPAHPLTAVKTVLGACLVRAAVRSSTAGAAEDHERGRRGGQHGAPPGMPERSRVRRGRAGGAASGVAAARLRTPLATRSQRFASARQCSQPREVFPGPAVYRLAGDVGDQVL